MFFSQVSALVSAGWGGPPGPGAPSGDDALVRLLAGRPRGRPRAKPPAPHGATDAGYLSQAHSPLARLSRPRRRTVSILRQNAAGVVVTRQRAAPAVSVPR